MKRFLAISALSAGLAMSVAATAAQSMGVGVVDMQQVLQSSSHVKRINADLKKQFASRKDKILAMAKKLQGDMASYTKNKAVMSKAKSAALRAQISTGETTLRGEQMKYQQDLLAAQNKAMSSFLKQLKSTVTKIASKKHLTVVFPKNGLLYAADDTDITSDVLKGLK